MAWPGRELNIGDKTLGSCSFLRDFGLNVDFVRRGFWKLKKSHKKSSSFHICNCYSESALLTFILLEGEEIADGVKREPSNIIYKKYWHRRIVFLFKGKVRFYASCGQRVST